MSESIDILLRDKISPSIKVKIEEIGRVADSSQNAIDRLQSRLKQLGASTVGRLNALLERLNKLGPALARLESGTSKAAVAENRAAIATARLAQAQNQAAISAKRLEISQIAVAKAEAQAAAAKDRAAIAALRLAQAQAKAQTGSSAPILGKAGKEALGMVGIGVGVAAVVGLADSYTNLQNKLSPVTETVAEQVSLIGQLSKVANSTFAPIQDTAQAFSRFDRALRQTGRSQQDAIKLTETVNKMLALSGAVGNEAGAALLQLSQAFNKGKLDGDEFRTVMELMPAAADAIAKELGVTRGELLKLAPEGKITTEIMARAFANASSEIDATFGRTIPTISQALVVAKNNIIEVLGVINNTTGIFTGTAHAVMLLANNLDSLAAIALVVGVNFAILNRLQIAAWFVKTGTAAKGLWAILAANPLVAIASLIAALIVNLDDLTDTFAKTSSRAKSFWNDLWSSDQEKRAKKFDEFLKKLADREHEERVKRMTAAQRDWNDKGDVAVKQMEQLAKWGYSYGEAVSWASRHTNVWTDRLAGLLDGLEGMSRYQKLLDANKNMTDDRFDIKKKEKKERVKKDPEEARWIWLQRINAELDNEIMRTRMLSDIREAEQRMNRIEEQAISRKIQLTDDERDSIWRKIEAIQEGARVQNQFDAMYEEAVGPARTYMASISAIGQLAEAGVYTQEQHARAMRVAALEYDRASDYLWEYNQAYLQEVDLSSRNSRDREIESKIWEARNVLMARGIELSDEAAQGLRDRYVALRRTNEVMAEQDAILEATEGKWRKWNDQLRAFEILQKKLTSGQQSQLTVGMLPEEFLSGTGVWFAKQIQDREDYYRQIDDMRKRDLLSEQEAEVAKLRIWQKEQDAKLSLASTFFSTFEGMQRSNHKEMAAIGKAAAIANATISAYQAANSAYAAMAGIPTVGPALGAAAALAALTSGMTNVAAIMSQPTGFREGGYTGNMGVNEVAGVVHGREFVFDAAATSRIGRANLEALRSGEAASVSGDSSLAVAPEVNIAFVGSQQEAETWLSGKDGQNIIVDAISKKARTINKILQGAK